MKTDSDEYLKIVLALTLAMLVIFLLIELKLSTEWRAFNWH